MTTRPIRRCEVCGKIITEEDDEDAQESDVAELCSLCNELRWGTT